MQTQSPKTPAIPSPNCLGCADCKGMCRDVFELAVVPETVLRRSAASP